MLCTAGNNASLNMVYFPPFCVPAAASPTRAHGNACKTQREELWPGTSVEPGVAFFVAHGSTARTRFTDFLLLLSTSGVARRSFDDACHGGGGSNPGVAEAPLDR